MFVQEWEEDFCSADEEQFMSEMGTIHPLRATNNTTYNKNNPLVSLCKCLPCLALPFLAPLPPCLPRHQQQKERKYAERRKYLIS